ncbi:sphingomyelin phosphodiesterase 2 [Ornithorhynchus anatinus]|uniref:Sphingomyelin phosphodiesterase 2 n=1 Tax=Ornithorhynchus anatinus TaxID=9258 RepID=A0A6I8NZE1_ORNAN|nr:sphingomyelin phosphodiesterase 2 [Ornithorhynchus anatinus]
MEPSHALRLQVFDLNCWAIRYLSQQRKERLQRLTDFLSQEHFDLVLLQEVWSERDFEELRRKLSKTYPAAHYFRSGFIGSGLCIFSKHPLREVFLHPFTLNGYPYMLQHGEWFCGKAVGLLGLQIGTLQLNAYVTHLHAEYDRESDCYLPHRVAQAWELAQFIHHTSKTADVVLLCGDLNMHPEDVGCRLLRRWTGLLDAFCETKSFEGCQRGYTLVPENYFVNPKELGPFPEGIRIDYVLFKASSELHISCETLRTTTGRSTSYSDHEALMATLCIQPGPSPAAQPSSNEPPLVDVLSEAREELGRGLARARQRGMATAGLLGLGLALLLGSMPAVAGSWGAWWSWLLLGAPGLALLMGAAARHLFYTYEAKALGEAETELQLVIEILDRSDGLNKGGPRALLEGGDGTDPKLDGGAK